MTRLANIGIFQSLPNPVLRALERGAVPMEPRHGMQIFEKGEAADAVYAIVGGEGHVRIGSNDRRGKRLMAEVFGAGDVFGEVGILDGGSRTAAAVADGRVRLLKVGAAPFLKTMQEQPALGEAVARALARRLRRTFALFEDASFETLEVRLARQIVYMAAQFGRADRQGIVLDTRLRQPDLADLLGATSRSIISILNDWRDAGTVLYDGECARLTIRDEREMRRLVELAG